ncbi:MAG TPA: branched-chain amino acid ABC transporter permease, partial [Vineibacter sp.]|nr:branched-chain amino acid ABC transporter permease [Vineibacter sp.]
MVLFEAVLSGILVGGMYGLIALGLNLQYGIARMMNLAYGEALMGGAFTAFWFFTLWRIDPLASMLFSVPVAFAGNWLVYRYLLTPLVRRAANQDVLEADTILVTFGLLFVFQGLALVQWGGEYRGYTYLALPVNVLGATVALNRLLAFAAAVALALVLYWLLRATRLGTAMRAIAIDPIAAQLVAIDVPRLSALAFATGGAIMAVAGTLVSMFLSFNASIGIVYTLKALIVVIMGGV